MVFDGCQWVFFEVLPQRLFLLFGQQLLALAVVFQATLQRAGFTLLPDQFADDGFADPPFVGGLFADFCQNSGCRHMGTLALLFGAWLFYAAFLLLVAVQ